MRRTPLVVGLLAAALALGACQDGQGPTDPKLSPTLAPPPPPPIGKNTFSGEATVVKAKVPLLGLDLKVVTAGPLPPAGGFDHDALATLGIPNLLSAKFLHAATVGQGNEAHSQAGVLSVNLIVGGHTIKAEVIRAEASAVCREGVPNVWGGSELLKLVIDGKAIVVSGYPNQVIPLLVGKIIINEQKTTANSITVNALHVSIPLVADVVISSAHADINCGPCGPAIGDFIFGDADFYRDGGAFVSSGFSAGINTDGTLGGHFQMNDQTAGVTVLLGKITSYSIVDSKTRKFTGTAQINGQPGTFVVIASDQVNPGAGYDTIAIQLSNGYSASGTIYKGNIRLSAQPPDCD